MGNTNREMCTGLEGQVLLGSTTPREDCEVRKDVLEAGMTVVMRAPTLRLSVGQDLAREVISMMLNSNTDKMKKGFTDRETFAHRGRFFSDLS